VPRLDAIGLTVADMAKSVRFYRLVGLNVPDPTGDHLDIDLGNGVRLMLDSLAMVKRFDPAWTAPSGHPFGLAVRCTSPREVDEVFFRVAQAGFRTKNTAPYDAPWGQRYATVLDPDGNAVDLYAPLG
jgi:uncharacterized glyoxalase superfamily protein PhnB